MDATPLEKLGNCESFKTSPGFLSPLARTLQHVNLVIKIKNMVNTLKVCQKVGPLVRCRNHMKLDLQHHSSIHGSAAILDLLIEDMCGMFFVAI